MGPFFVLLLLVSCLSTPIKSSVDISGAGFSRSELLSLHKFFNSTNGQFWNWLTPFDDDSGYPWNFSSLNVNPCQALWQGLSCSSMVNSDGEVFDSVVSLNLEQYNLSGFLSNDGLEGMKNLQVLDLQINDIFGSIPSAIMNLLSLRELLLGNNRLSGSVSTAIGVLSNLTNLELESNQLSGSIPSTVGNLLKLQVLQLGGNKFSGSIPEEFYGLKAMYFMGLYSNYLTGTISTTVDQLFSLDYFYIYENLLSGPMPAEINNLVLLGAIDVGYNSLVDRLPPNLQGFANAFLIDVSSNELTGPCPSSTEFWEAVSYLGVSSNMMTGPITLEMTEDSRITNIDYSQNFFTGSLPSSVGNLSYLSIFSVGENHLTGSLPNLMHSAFLSNLVLNDNYFTGCLDNVLMDNNTYLTVLELSNNQFTGTIPSSWMFSDIEYFGVADNFLSGTIGSAFASSPFLSTMLLASNDFSGPVANIINADLQTFLTTVDLSENRFTGQLPTLGAQMAFLTTFVAAVNCIHTSLLTDWCAIDTLEVLVLDGLNAASGCHRNNERPGLKGSIPLCLFTMPALQTLHLSGNSIGGRLPAQLMSNATSLSASSDSTDVKQQLSSTFVQLSLSHNAFSGSIPEWIWKHEAWIELDLSFNRFFGHLPDSPPLVPSGNASLYLDLNRLSGRIPRSLRAVDPINVLKGNLFACDFERTSLPAHDSSRASYVCGSDTINNGLVLWLALIGVCFVVWLVMWYRGGSLRHSWPNVIDFLLQSNRRHSAGGLSTQRTDGGASDLQTSTSADDSTGENDDALISRNATESFDYFLADLRDVVQLLLRGTMVLLVIGIPVYTALTVEYGSYETQYAWTLSASYLEGFIPAIVLLVLLVIFVVVYDRVLLTLQLEAKRRRQKMVAVSAVKTLRPSAESPSPEGESQLDESDSLLSSSVSVLVIVRIVRILLVVCDGVLVIAVNGAYVYLLTQNLPTVALAFATLALSVFKISWGWLVVNKLETIARILLFWLLSQYQGSSMDGAKTVASLSKWKALPMFGTQSTVWITLFNNVVAPYCAEMFASPNCFLYVYTAVPQVTSSYNFDQCYVSAIALACFQSTREVGYEPAFNYDYLCSASLLTSFAFVFLVRYVLSGVVMPVWLLVMERVTLGAYRRDHLEKQSRAMCGWINTETYVSILFLLQPYRQRPSDWFIDKYGLLEEGVVKSVLSTVIKNPLVKQNENEDGKVSDHRMDPPVPPTVDACDRSCDQGRHCDDVFVLNRLLPSRKEVIVRTVNDVALFVTYGALFPPLAAVIVFSFVVEVWQLLVRWEVLLAVVRRVCVRRRLLLLVQLRSLSEGFGRFERSVFPALRQLSFLAAVFWSFTLLDTLGGAEGALQGAWIVVVMGSAPAWLWVVRWLARQVLTAGAHVRSNQQLGTDNSLNSPDDTGTKDKKADIELGPVKVSPTVH